MKQNIKLLGYAFHTILETVLLFGICNTNYQYPSKIHSHKTS